MKEGFWGILIITLGLFGIVLMQLFQNVVVTNDNTYYLVKEVTEAAMIDSIDLTYYRTTGQLKIVEDKFVENFTRRFAESATLNREYNIKIHEVIETPPKVSISMGTYVISLEGEQFNIKQTVDAILETKYKCEEVEGLVCNGTPGTEPEKEENACPVCKAGEDPNCNAVKECINGDLRFVGWEDINVSDKICKGDTLPSKTRDAMYQSCVCGKWEDKSDAINANPVYVATGYSYTWNFKKTSEVRTIQSSITEKGTYDTCLEDIDIKTETGVICPKEGFKIAVGQSLTIVPEYIPENAVNRGLTWTSSNERVATVQYPNPSTIGPTGTSNAVVSGKSVGESTITAKSTNNKTGTCKVTVDNTSTWACPGLLTVNALNSIQATIIDGTVPVGATWKIQDTNIATIDSNGLITAKDVVGKTNYIISSSGLPTLTCPLTVVKPKLACPSTILTMNTNSTKQATLKEGTDLTGIKWSISNTNIATVDENTGKITSKNAKETIKYTASKPGYYSASCDLNIVKESKESTSIGCTPGEILVDWNIEDKKLPALCPQDFEYQTICENSVTKEGCVTEMPAASKLELITSKTSYCGRFGGYTYDDKYRWDYQDTFRAALITGVTPDGINESAGTYTITLNKTYTYDNHFWSNDVRPYVTKSGIGSSYTISGKLKGRNAEECKAITLESKPIVIVNGAPTGIVVNTSGAYLSVVVNPSTEFVSGYWESSAPNVIKTNKTTGFLSALKTGTATIRYIATLKNGKTVVGESTPIEVYGACGTVSLSGFSTIWKGQSKSLVLNPTFGGASEWMVSDTGKLYITSDSLTLSSSATFEGNSAGIVTVTVIRAVDNCKITKQIEVKSILNCPSDSSFDTYFYDTDYCYNPYKTALFTCSDGYIPYEEECYAYTDATLGDAYSCPSGTYKIGSKCYTYKATATKETTYSCDSGDYRSGKKCYVYKSDAIKKTIYSCPNGDYLSGSTCYDYKTGARKSGTTYKCSNTNYTLYDTNKCGTTYNATAEDTYSCKPKTLILYTNDSGSKKCGTTYAATAKTSYVCSNIKYKLYDTNKCGTKSDAIKYKEYQCTNGTVYGPYCVNTDKSTSQVCNLYYTGNIGGKCYYLTPKVEE